MNQLVNATDKRIPEGSVQAGMIRIPIMVLMTDGEPTAASKAYTNIQTSNVGTGSSSVNNKSDMAFLTQLTAAMPGVKLKRLTAWVPASIRWVMVLAQVLKPFACLILVMPIRQTA